MSTEWERKPVAVHSQGGKQGQSDGTKITEFDNVEWCEQLIVTAQVDVRST